MAKQESFIKLTGKVGDITFRKTSKGYTAHQISKIDPNVLLNSPKAQILRENKAEFARSVIYSKMLRDALRPVTQFCKDKYHNGRLNAIMLRVIKLDTVNQAGLRSMNDALENELLGFEFNERNKLDGVFYPAMSITIDKPKLIAQVNIPEFKTHDYFQFNAEASFAKIKMSMVACNFETGQYSLVSEESTELYADTENTAALSLETTFIEPVSGYIVVLLGVEFYRNINGFLERLYQGTSDSLKVVSVASV